MLASIAAQLCQPSPAQTHLHLRIFPAHLLLLCLKLLESLNLLCGGLCSSSSEGACRAR